MYVPIHDTLRTLLQKQSNIINKVTLLNFLVACVYYEN